MTSKSFKGLLSANELNVVGYGDSSQVDLLIRRSDRAITSTGIAIAPSDAPALALAILEAAYGSDQPAATKIGEAWAALYAHIAEQERTTAEAKPQAELEAEALELANTYLSSMGVDLRGSFDDMTPFNQEHWLAVARKARELAKEATK